MTANESESTSCSSAALCGRASMCPFCPPVKATRAAVLQSQGWLQGKEGPTRNRQKVGGGWGHVVEVWPSDRIPGTVRHVERLELHFATSLPQMTAFLLPTMLLAAGFASAQTAGVNSTDLAEMVGLVYRQPVVRGPRGVEHTTLTLPDTDTRNHDLRPTRSHGSTTCAFSQPLPRPTASSSARAPRPAHSLPIRPNARVGRS